MRKDNDEDFGFLGNLMNNLLEFINTKSNLTSFAILTYVNNSPNLPGLQLIIFNLRAGYYYAWYIYH